MDTKAVMDGQGRVCVPEEIRRSLGIHPGDTLVLKMDRDGLKMIPIRAAVLRAQGLVRRYVPENHSLSDDILADRREEASHE